MAKNSVFGQSRFVTLDNTDILSLKLYKDNKPSHFKIRLPAPIHLDGPNWACGLVWGRFPFSWKSITKACRFGLLVMPYKSNSADSIFVSRSSNPSTNVPLYRALHLSTWATRVYPITDAGLITYIFPSGYYPSRYAVGKKMEEDINRLLTGSTMYIRFLDLPNGKFAFEVHGGYLGLFTQDPTIMEEVLGFELSVKENNSVGGPIMGVDYLEELECTGRKQTTFEAYDSFEVYCDAIEPYMYSSTMAPHLAAISAGNHKPGVTFVHHANPIVYYPVADNYFRELEVKLCYRTGDLVEFTGGASDHVSLHLHFQQRMFGI